MAGDPRLKAIQARINELGYGPIKVDGYVGDETYTAFEAVLSVTAARIGVKPPPLPPVPPPIVEVRGRVLPKQWLQPAVVRRIHLHWTAGGHRASETDKDHYHVLVEGDAKVVKGNCDISANSAVNPSGQKAHHTLNANTGALAVSMCCMAGALERKSDGEFPLTKEQWDKAAIVVAELCKHYSVPVTNKTVLSHAEVQKNLGITQRGKWDVAILPWDRQYDTSWECGDLFRKQVQEHLNGL